jgi:putative membrane protein
MAMRWGKGTRLAAAMAALALAGCQWLGREDGTATTAEPAATAQSTLEDEMFLASALAHVDSQLALARMAAQKGKTPSLLAYAKSVADERTGLADRLAAAARQDGVGSDTGKAPRLDDFTPLKGEAFERAYVAAEIEDQQNNLDSFDFEAAHGTDPALKDLAAAELPRLKQDLAQAAAIVKDLPFGKSGANAESGMESPPAAAGAVR